MTARDSISLFKQFQVLKFSCSSIGVFDFEKKRPEHYVSETENCIVESISLNIFFTDFELSL